ncbi:DeoR family transcriptional regulator [Staphylococcus shinii]|uniref:DeoR family transcriptional regulator n=1 Tax=Staphylococcus shinii TaxID=2912228 RepID=UPI00298F0F61|nr:DeoR family transcriptional regulator [Staphylococcus shinii]MDW8574214.1 DeoR family transcriptional regulator [Staphylococcus shinii]
MKSKRIHEIENYINEKKAASIDELSEFFNVSINTIRRDITILANMNKVKKVYGGIETIENTISQAVDYSKRNISHFEEKNISLALLQNISKQMMLFISILGQQPYTF